MKAVIGVSLSFLNDLMSTRARIIAGVMQRRNVKVPCKMTLLTVEKLEPKGRPIASSASDGIGPMTNNDEFRANAAECERMADATKNPSDKRRWMKMAENWLRMITPARQTPNERFDAAERSHGTHQTQSGESH